MRRLALCWRGVLLGVILPDIGTGQGKKDAKTGEINTPPAPDERKFTTLRAGVPKSPGME
jgi:hypothetical protein